MEQSLRQIGRGEENYTAELSQTTLWSFQGVFKAVQPAITVVLCAKTKFVLVL